MAALPSPPRNDFFGLAPRHADALALTSGALLVPAFAPGSLFPLAVLSPALLFLLWLPATPGRAAWRGFLYGLGMFGAGVSWVYVSLHHYGNMPAPMAAFATLLFVAVLALFPALVGYAQARWFPLRGMGFTAVALPALWVLAEWWRGWFLTGFPWLHLGYSQAGTWLAGYAPWLGVYGVSLACAVSAGLVAQTLRVPRKSWRLCLPLLAAVWAGGWAAGQVQWVQPVGEPLRAALVQASVSLADKWHPEKRSAIAHRYLELSQAALGAELIVWPEAAIPAYLDEARAELDTVARLAREHGSEFLIGVVERTLDRRRYYNSVVAVGATAGIYRKQHLVPFGEFLPLRPWTEWLLDYLQIPMSNFSRGAADQPPLVAAGRRVGITICYEDAFGEEVIRLLPEAELLVNVSEDAWFGNSLAPHQRLQMARLRSLETGRPMLRAANTGPSAAIDHRGVVIARSPQFRPFVLLTQVQPMQGATPYARFGNLPVVLALLAALAAVGLFPRLMAGKRG